MQNKLFIFNKLTENGIIYDWTIAAKYMWRIGININVVKYWSIFKRFNP